MYIINIYIMIICNANYFSIMNLYCLHKHGTTFLWFIICMSYFTEHLQLYCKIQNYTKTFCIQVQCFFLNKFSMCLEYQSLFFQKTSKAEKYIFNNPLLFLLLFLYIHSYPYLLNLQHYISSQASIPTLYRIFIASIKVS